jgi:hypothetical protein
MRLQCITEVDVPEDLGSFQEVEEKVREAMFRSGAQILEQAFDLFEKLALETKHYWMKDRREKTYETRIGSIPRSRLRVWDHRQERYRYPLDEWLGVKSGERVTHGLKRAIVEASVERSYRKATSEINRWTAVSRKHGANWKLIQKVASEERKKEPKVPNWHLKPIPAFNLSLKEDPCPILAIDPDGTYCRSQRKTHKDHDVKVAVLYPSKSAVDGKKKRWKLDEKQVLFSQSHESIKDFFNRVTHRALSHYGAHAETKVIIHGDGDLWIKGLKDNFWDQALIRLDPWHLKKKIRIATGGLDIPSEWESAIYGRPDLLIRQVQMWKVAHTAPKSPEREKVEELISYIQNNREGLLPSGVSAEIKQKYPRMFKRGSGTIESNIGHTFNVRFKQARMNWSGQGLDNLSYLREKHLNRHKKPTYLVPQPLTRQSVAQEMGRALH